MGNWGETDRHWEKFDCSWRKLIVHVTHGETGQKLGEIFIYFFFGGGDFVYFFVLYSALLHLPPLRFHYADGCWDRTQDRCNWCIGSQTL